MTSAATLTLNRGITISRTKNANRSGLLTALRELIPNRRLTKPEIRRVTEQQANLFRRLLGIKKDRFPIETVDTIEDIELHYEPDMPMSAMTMWAGTKWLTVINHADSSRGQRFSTLHELHHVVTDPHRHQMFGTKNMMNPDAEQAADYFSMSVLMPRSRVDFYLDHGADVFELAERFDVSVPTMKCRLTQLGHAKKRPGEQCKTHPDHKEVA